MKVGNFMLSNKGSFILPCFIPPVEASPSLHSGSDVSVKPSRALCRFYRPVPVVSIVVPFVVDLFWDPKNSKRLKQKKGTAREKAGSPKP